MTEYYGTLRITNANTLKRWKLSGKYQELIDAGYTYAWGCGRFRIEQPCTCSRCKKLKEDKK